MEACLYDPEGGFFSSGPLRSVKSGDFLTSPEVSPWFGRSIASFVASVFSLPGQQARVVEVGAGSGSLLGPLMEELGDGFDYHAVEVSPAARDALQRLLHSDHVHTSLADLSGRFTGVVIANELLDNLPAALAVRGDHGWEERWVGVADGRLELVEAEARSEVVAWCDAYAGDVASGGMVEVEMAAAEWVTDALGRLERGALLVIDYGGTAEELEPRRTQGTLRTYRAHHLGPDPLLEPGATDITADVNFTAMMAVAARADARVELLRQDDFLARLGLRDVVSELRRKELELARSENALERLAVRSELIDAETLLHPRGLGDFRVLIAVVPPNARA